MAFSRIFGVLRGLGDLPPHRETDVWLGRVSCCTVGVETGCFGGTDGRVGFAGVVDACGVLFAVLAGASVCGESECGGELFEEVNGDGDMCEGGVSVGVEGAAGPVGLSGGDSGVDLAHLSCGGVDGVGGVFGGHVVSLFRWCWWVRVIIARPALFGD